MHRLNRRAFLERSRKTGLSWAAGATILANAQHIAGGKPGKIHVCRSVLLSHLANISYRLGGQRLVLNAKTETIVGSDDAIKLYRREYRKPLVIPEEV